MTGTSKLFAVILLFATATASVMAQTAEMPEPKDFMVGDTWEWRQMDNRTNLEEGKRSRSVVNQRGILKFQSERGTFYQLSNSFLGNPRQIKPWRTWPLEIGKEWEYEEDRTDGNRSVNTKQDAKVVAYEEVTVPAGKFMTFKIEYKGYYRNSQGGSGRQADTYWYAPDVKADVKWVRDDGYNNWARELVVYKRAPQPGSQPDAAR